MSGSKRGDPHTHLFWRNGPNRAVRRGHWKLIQTDNHVWLFDLKTDPGELKNLAEKHPDVVRELQNAIERAVILCPGEMISEEDIKLSGLGAGRGVGGSGPRSAVWAWTEDGVHDGHDAVQARAGKGSW